VSLAVWVVLLHGEIVCLDRVSLGRLATSVAHGARSRTQRAGTARPGTGFDEYQAMQLLDEDVVKRGVSSRKMRTLLEQPGTLQKLLASHNLLLLSCSA